MSAIFNDADIPNMLMACGAVPCTIGGVVGIGLLDQDENLYGQGNGEVVDQTSTVTVQTTAFPLARIDDVLTIDGRTGSVKQRLKVGDGGLTRFLFALDTAVPTVPRASSTGGRVVIISADYTAVAGDDVIVDTTAGPVTVTLPLAADNDDKGITVGKVSSDTNAVTVVPSGGDEVEFDTSVEIGVQNMSLDFVASSVLNVWRIQ